MHIFRWHLVIFFLLVSHPFSSVLGVWIDENARSEIMKILDGPNYNKEVPPIPEGQTRGPAVVRLRVALRRLGQFNDITMEATAEVVLQVEWNDPRLQFPINGSATKYLPLNEDMAGKIWTPGLFIVNEASSFLHTLLKPNVYMRLYCTGKVNWNLRLTTTISCPMDFTFFPFDSQVCQVKIGEFKDDSNDVVIQWVDIYPIVFDYDMVGGYESQRFRFKKFETGSGFTRIVETETLSYVYVNFHLTRRSSMYLVNLYFPTGSFVGLSWVSFWLGHDTNVRLSTSVTILLTLITVIQNSIQQLPKISYITALDIWSTGCMIACTFTILENATVAYLLHFNKHRPSGSNGNKVGVGITELENSLMSWTQSDKFVTKLDNYAKILCPIFFSFFMAGYIQLFVVGQEWSKQYLKFVNLGNGGGGLILPPPDTSSTSHVI